MRGDELDELARSIDRAIAEAMIEAGAAPAGATVEGLAANLAELVALGVVVRVWDQKTGEVGLRVLDGEGSS